MEIIIGLSIVIGSGILGGYLDTYKNIEEPTLYWILGVAGGFISAVVINSN